jgi:hypothetical protein
MPGGGCSVAAPRRHTEAPRIDFHPSSFRVTVALEKRLDLSSITWMFTQPSIVQPMVSDFALRFGPVLIRWALAVDSLPAKFIGPCGDKLCSLAARVFTL